MENKEYIFEIPYIQTRKLAYLGEFFTQRGEPVCWDKIINYFLLSVNRKEGTYKVQKTIYSFHFQDKKYPNMLDPKFRIKVILFPEAQELLNSHDSSAYSEVLSELIDHVHQYIKYSFANIDTPDFSCEYDLTPALLPLIENKNIHRIFSYKDQVEIFSKLSDISSVNFEKI